MADGAASSNKRKEQPEEAADSERNVRPRIDDSSGAPKLASLEGLKALRALPDLVDSRSLASASRGWFWRVRDSLLGGIISRLTAASSVLRRRAPQLELWEIEAVLPQMEASAKEICDLWCTLRNRLETQLRRQKWCQLARECLALGQDELPINLDGLDVMSVETQSFAMPAVSVIPPPPTQPPPPPPGNGVTPAPFQGPVTMPLLGPGPAPAVAALGPGTAVPAAVAAPAFAAQAPGVQNMPGTLPAQFLGVLPMPNPPAAGVAGVAGVAGAALPVAPPVATAIASNTAQQVAGVVHQLINQVMQGPAGGAAGAAPATAAGQRETVRLNIVRVIEFSLADQRVAGRLYLGFETEGQRENGGTEARSAPRPDILARSAPRPDILCVEVELAVDAGKFTQLCSAHRMVHIAAGENRSFGPWTCTERREVEKRWLELRAKALGVQGLSLDLRHFMRLMAGLLGAALLTEPVSHRRLWNGLKPVVVGPSPMARLRVGLGGMNLTTSFPEPKDRDSGALPMGPAELLAHPPFADYVL